MTLIFNIGNQVDIAKLHNSQIDLIFQYEYLFKLFIGQQALETNFKQFVL